MKKIILFTILSFSISLSAQIEIASDINQGNYGSKIGFLFEFKNEIYFSAEANEDQNNPIKSYWKTDGTENGTVQLENITTTPFLKSDNYFYYYKSDNTIWKTDGVTSNDTKILDTYNFSDFRVLGTFKDELYYLARINVERDVALHKTNGTTTTIVKTFTEEQYVTYRIEPELYKLDDTKFVIYLYTVNTGVEPYISDGTEAGTYLLKDVTPGSNHTRPSNFLKIDNNFVFNNDKQVLSTDGTEEGTVQLSYFGNNSSQKFIKPVLFNNKVYYGFDDELFETDGTQAGTRVVFKNNNSDGEVEGIVNNGINLIIFLRRGIHVFNGTTTTKLDTPDITSTYNTNYIKSDSKVYFTANYKNQGNRLWTTDGTSAATTSIEPFWPDGETPYGLMHTIGNNLIFSLSTSTGNHYNMGELWSTDGTRTNTVMFKDINQFGNGSSSPKFQTTLNGKIYFAADDNINGRELFVFDGTTTSLVKDINPGIHSSNPNDFYLINNKIFFKAYTVDKGHELWVTDGTESGTNIVKDINLNEGNAFKYLNTGVHNIIGEFSIYNNELYFYANNGVNGYEPWKTDGTEAGTKLIKDINSGSASSTNYDLGNRPKFIPFKNELYFFASKSGPDYQLSKIEMWKTDGTASGTKLATAGNTLTKEGTFNNYNLFVFQDHLYFMGEGRYTRKNNFFKTDGTNAGTKIIEDFGYSGGLATAFPLLDKVYYTRNSGKEIWTIDKDDTKTQITNTISGFRYTNSNDFYNHNNYLYFAIGTQTYQTELWRLSDTTTPEKLFTKETESGTSSIENYFDYVANGDKLFVNTKHNGNSDFIYRMYLVENNATLTPAFSINNNDVRYENLTEKFESFCSFSDTKIYFTGTFEDKGEELLIADLSAVLNIKDYNNSLVDDQFNITLFPNPVINVLNIKSKSTIKMSDIYTVLGKKIATTTSNSIDVSKLNSGMYIIKIEDEFGNISSKKWIKN